MRQLKLQNNTIILTLHEIDLDPDLPELELGVHHPTGVSTWINLTPKQARRQRDWLDGWLDQLAKEEGDG